jgi:hypothetical protein
MKKIYLFILITSLICGKAYAQSIDLSWGPEQKYNFFNHEYGSVGKVGDFVYTLREEKDVFYLSKIRAANMSTVFVRALTWNDKRRNANAGNYIFNELRMFKTHFVLFFEEKDKKESQQIIYAQKISFEGESEGEAVRLGTRETARRSKDGSFALEYTADSSKLLLVQHPTYEKYANEKFVFRIFDSNLKSLYGLEISLPYSDKDVEVKDIRLAKNNIIHLLIRIDIPKKERNRDEATYYYEILSIDAAKKGATKEYELKLDKKYISEASIILDKKDNIKCFGMYADMRNNGKAQKGINGVFNFGLNPAKKQIENVNVKEFDALMIAELSGAKRAKSDKGIKPFFNIKYIFDKADGGMIVMTEEQYVQVVTTTTGRSTSTHYHYHDNNILAVNLDPMGKIIWYSRIPKLQYTVDDRSYNSFYATYVDKKAYLVYNDDPENALKNNYERTMRNVTKAKPVMVTLDDSGKFTKSILTDSNKDSQFVIRPSGSRKINDRETMIMGHRVTKGCCFIGGGGAKTIRFGLLQILNKSKNSI